MTAADTVRRVLTWRRAEVTAVSAGWPGATTLQVRLEDGSTGLALAYPAMVGQLVPGDRVLLNTTATDLDLGTGGYAMVVAAPDRLPPPEPFEGHVVKARYTPQQTTVLAVDDPASPHYAAVAEADDLAGMPVVVADLHSALPAVVAAVRAGAPQARVAYVMTDGGALAMWFSQTVAQLSAAGWLAGTVSTGQAFGGELEAVTVHTGLVAARHVLGADVAVVTQGPGNLGTGTRFGFSGVAAGEAVNAAVTLGGRPVAALRVSAADPRPRHRGLSHHSLTAYGRVALAPADVALPVGADPFWTAVAEACAPLAARHRIVHVALEGLAEALRGSPAPLRTMGRGFDEDPAYFLAQAAAGRHAANLLAGRPATG